METLMDYTFIFERLNEERGRSEERPRLQIPVQEERPCDTKNPPQDQEAEEGVILPSGIVNFVV